MIDARKPIAQVRTHSFGSWPQYSWVTRHEAAVMLSELRTSRDRFPTARIRSAGEHCRVYSLAPGRTLGTRTYPRTI